METETFETVDAMMQAVNNAVADGWQRFPFEVAARGEVGVWLSRPGKEADEERSLIWRPFGELLGDITSCGSPEDLPGLLARWEGSPTLVKMDDPKQLRLGVVHYDRPGYATGLSFPLRVVKALSTQLRIDGQLFIEWRKTARSLGALAGVQGWPGEMV